MAYAILERTIGFVPSSAAQKLLSLLQVTVSVPLTIEKGGHYENGRVASPGSVIISK